MIYELKTYVAHEGRFEAMRERFLSEAAPRLAAHGVEVVQVFETNEKPPRLLYLTRGADADALAQGWAAFGADPDWQEVKRSSEAEGPLLATQTGLRLTALELRSGS